MARRARRQPTSSDSLLRKVLRTPSYRGRHVILVHGKIYSASSRAEMRRLFDKAAKEFPGETPLLAYIPRADALVLVLL